MDAEKIIAQLNNYVDNTKHGFSIGDLVTNGQLRSGCSYFHAAVLVSLDPVILISENGDMLFNGYSMDDLGKSFNVVGKAHPSVITNCIKRIKRDNG